MWVSILQDHNTQMPILTHPFCILGTHSTSIAENICREFIFHCWSLLRYTLRIHLDFYIKPRFTSRSHIRFLLGVFCLLVWGFLVLGVFVCVLLLLFEVFFEIRLHRSLTWSLLMMECESRFSEWTPADLNHLKSTDTDVSYQSFPIHHKRS